MYCFTGGKLGWDVEIAARTRESPLTSQCLRLTKSLEDMTPFPVGAVT